MTRAGTGGLLVATMIVVAMARALAAGPASAPPGSAAQTAAPAVQAVAPPADPGTEQGADAQSAQPSQPVPSILLWPDEVQAIAKAVDEHDHPPAADLAAKARATASAEAAAEATKPKRPNVYVSAILDFGGGDWTVWVNGLRVTPQQQSPLFKVTAVHGNMVDITVPGEGGGKIRLQPYQTWRSRQGDVVEGIVP